MVGLNEKQFPSTRTTRISFFWGGGGVVFVFGGRGNYRGCFCDVTGITKRKMSKNSGRNSQMVPS